MVKKSIILVDFNRIRQNIYIYGETELIIRDFFMKKKSRKKPKVNIPKEIKIIWVYVIESYS